MHRALLILLFVSGLAATVRACPECGGKGKALWAAAEAQPKASQLYPEARIVDYTLEVAETVLARTGKPVRVLTLNGATPGPTLRFQVGDVARITVINRLAREETSIHWHGLLVPNLEDGVPHLTTPPLRPGQSRTFEFLLKHAGTYWYHSHTGLQEQRGVHGSIVIAPREGTPPRADLPRIDRDEVLVLTDWTNESPAEVLRTLVRGSEWYAIRKGTAQSLWGAWREGHLAEYLDRERARLPAMDVSDVAYDAFHMNGRPRQRLAARPGETVRLRVINAASSTYFYLSSAAGPLTIVAADGIDVVPIRQRRLLIGMAETYDVLVTVPAGEPAAWEVRATAQDNSGHASLLLGEGEERAAPAPGKLEVYSMDAALGAMLDEMDRAGDVSDAAALAAEDDRPLPPYKRLRATAPTTLPAAAPRREITLRLTGDMGRYQWSINGRTIDEQSTVPVRSGEVLRLVLVNDTMMHHPMHLHGHFFRLLVPAGAPLEYSPLKHTVDVPPMSRRTIEFLANEDRDWLFHCHLLYHHKTGMARVFSYPAGEAEREAEAGASDAGRNPSPSRAAHQPGLGDHARPHRFTWIEGTVQSHLTEGVAVAQQGRDNLYFAWDVAWERGARREYEVNGTYARYFNPRWSAFAGYRLTNEAGGTDGAIGGATYLLPYLVPFTVTLHSRGEARASIGRTLALTPRFGLAVRADYDTGRDFSWQAGLRYTLTKELSVTSTYDSNAGWGAGLGFRF